jgi:hypothetical protein
MTKPLNLLRQRYDVLGGSLELVLRTEHGVTADELDDFRAVAGAAENYAERRPPEDPRAKADRLAAQARAEEWRED